MKTGPRKKPTAIELYQGNPGHKTKAELTDTLQPVLCTQLAPPACLDEVATQEWNRLVPELIRYKVLSDLDRNALAIYCQAWSDYMTLSTFLNKNGLTYKTKEKTTRARVEVGMRRNAFADLLRVSSEFGFTPSSRAGMQLNFNAVRKSTSQLLDDLDFDHTFES